VNKEESPRCFSQIRSRVRRNARPPAGILFFQLRDDTLYRTLSAGKQNAQIPGSKAISSQNDTASEKMAKIAKSQVPVSLLNQFAKSAVDLGKTSRSSIILVDYSRPSNEPRFYVVNVGTGDVESIHVAHPKKSSANGHPEMATKFSNEAGSSQASLGLYQVDLKETPIHRDNPSKILKVTGLQQSNNQARTRAASILGVRYVSDETGRVGFTNGLSFPIDVSAYKRLIGLMKGALLYAGKSDRSKSGEETLSSEAYSILGCSPRSQSAPTNRPVS